MSWGIGWRVSVGGPGTLKDFQRLVGTLRGSYDYHPPGGRRRHQVQRLEVHPLDSPQQLHQAQQADLRGDSLGTLRDCQGLLGTRWDSKGLLGDFYGLSGTLRDS